MSILKKSCTHQTYQRNWAQIWGKYQGSLFLLPSETSEVIVQYQPSLVISAVLPPQQRTITVEYPKVRGSKIEVEIKSPNLIISQVLIESSTNCYASNGEACTCRRCAPTKTHPTFCRCQSVCRYKSYTSQYLLHVYDSQQLWAWKFANVVADHNTICFGEQANAKNLRQANNNFWASNFNNSAIVGTIHHRRGKCPDSTHYYGYGSHNIHQNPCYKKVEHKCSCNCTDKQRHNVFSCRGCDCPCTCACCSKTCQCICNCVCCRHACDCACTCESKLYGKHFAEYLQQIAPLRGTKTNGSTILGSARFQMKSGADAVFLSYDPSLVRQAKAVYKDRWGAPFIIGLARENPDDSKEWEIWIDGEIYIFNSRELGIA